MKEWKNDDDRHRNRLSANHSIDQADILWGQRFLLLSHPLDSETYITMFSSFFFFGILVIGNCSVGTIAPGTIIEAFFVGTETLFVSLDVELLANDELLVEVIGGD